MITTPEDCPYCKMYGRLRKHSPLCPHVRDFDALVEYAATISKRAMEDRAFRRRQRKNYADRVTLLQGKVWALRQENNALRKKVARQQDS